MKYNDKYVLHQDDASMMLLLKHGQFQREIIERGGEEYSDVILHKESIYLRWETLWEFTMMNSRFINSNREKSVIFP